MNKSMQLDGVFTIMMLNTLFGNSHCQL